LLIIILKIQKLKEHIQHGKSVSDDENDEAQTFDSAKADDALISNDKWRVLSTDNGIIQLIPDIATVEKTNIPQLTMYGANGYLNGETVLNEMCKTLYSSDIGTARSININDIDKKVGYNNSIWYNKNGALTKVPEGVTTLGELEDKENLEINEDYRTMPGGGDASKLKLNYYSYYVYEREDQKNEDGTLKYINKFLAEDSNKDNALYDFDGENIEFDLLAYDTIEEKYGISFNANITTKYSPYWIANRAEDICLNTNSENSYIKYGLRIMSNGSVARRHMWNAKEGAQDGDNIPTLGVVPVVTLKTGLQVEWSDTESAWKVKN